jgi:hypothetical protein
MDEQTPTAAATPSPEPAPASAEAVPAAAAPALTESAPHVAEPSVAERLAALEREQWLRDRFEKEHQVTLALMRLLLAGLSGQSRLMRFWRWLIDDFRSERRLLADPNRELSEERVLINQVLAWFRAQGFSTNRPGPGGQAEGSGQ